jgi:CRISPR-associated exonuclease Cas4
MYEDTDLLMISALQHLLFCPRQCALIHIEQVWAENRYTMEGQFLHERVHNEQAENRKAFRIEYGMPLRSRKLGLIGKADVVEIEYTDDSRKQIKRMTPVEYKRGKPKVHNADNVQLCAQALCLEEMLNIQVADGLIYYGKKRRRTFVEFTPALKQETAETARKLHELFDGKKTPPPEFSEKCSLCSLYDFCMPEKVKKSVHRYLEKQKQLALGDKS